VVAELGAPASEIAYARWTDLADGDEFGDLARRALRQVRRGHGLVLTISAALTAAVIKLVGSDHSEDSGNRIHINMVIAHSPCSAGLSTLVGLAPL
jgi:hypothetical protein